MDSCSEAHSVSDILKYYHQQFCSPDDIKIGIEWERTGVYYNDFTTPVSYVGDNGYRSIINGLEQQYGWHVEDAVDGNTYTLLRENTRITVEGDGKPEISGAPFLCLLDNKKELESIAAEIESIAKPLGIHFVTQGISPLFHHQDIPLVPKPRYQIWDEIFPEPQWNDWMHRYMKNLSGVHINMGCSSEKDLITKNELFLRLSPVLCGVFANAPFIEGKKGDVLSVRRKSIFTHSFGREEMLIGFFERNFSLERWIDWYLDRDLIIIIRGEKNFLPPRGFTFRAFLERGFEGEKATYDDFDAHIKTCWTDIRFRKGYLEFRALDTLPLPEVMGVTALLKGLLYSSEGNDAIRELTKKWNEKDLLRIHEEAWKYGGNANWEGISFFTIIKELLPVAEKCLQNIRKNEEILLEPVWNIVHTKKTPAEQLIDTKSLIGDL